MLDRRKIHRRNDSSSKFTLSNFGDLHSGDLTFGEVHSNRLFQIVVHIEWHLIQFFE